MDYKEIKDQLDLANKITDSLVIQEIIKLAFLIGKNTWREEYIEAISK